MRTPLFLFHSHPHYHDTVIHSQFFPCTSHVPLLVHIFPTPNIQLTCCYSQGYHWYMHMNNSNPKFQKNVYRPFFNERI